MNSGTRSSDLKKAWATLVEAQSAGGEEAIARAQEAWETLQAGRPSDDDPNHVGLAALGDGVVVSGDRNAVVIRGNVVGHDIDVEQGAWVVYGNLVRIGAAKQPNDPATFEAVANPSKDSPQGTPDKLLPVISGEQAFERIGAAVRLNLNQLERNIEQARSESRQFFSMTLIFSGAAFIVALAGVLLLLVRQVTVGIVTSVASTMPELTAALFFTKDRELRKTIEAYHKHMLESQKMLTMIDVAETIQDAGEKDRMKQEIIFKVLGIKEVIGSGLREKI